MLTIDRTDAKCPYCGHRNDIDASKLDDSYINVIECDGYEGGCGGMFGIQAKMILDVVSVYELVEHYASVPTE